MLWLDESLNYCHIQIQLILIKASIWFTVHSTRIPHFPQNSEENLSFARKPTENII